jgi:hypothetical protein
MTMVNNYGQSDGRAYKIQQIPLQPLNMCDSQPVRRFTEATCLTARM